MAPLPCHLRGDRLEIGSLHIRFHRTKFAANQNMEDPLEIEHTMRLRPPPSEKIGHVNCTIKPEGLYAQINQDDVFWIEFKTTELYLVRVYVNGVNAITGRDFPLPKEQDYLIIAEDQELTCYKSSPTNKVRFTCPPFSDGQANASNRANIQFEVTPYGLGCSITVWFKHRILFNSGKAPVRVPAFATVRQFKDCIKRRLDSIDHWRIARQFRLLQGTSSAATSSQYRRGDVYLDQLEDDSSLEDANIRNLSLYWSAI